MKKYIASALCVLSLIFYCYTHTRNFSVSTKQEYQIKVLKSNKPVVVKFWSPHCHSCTSIKEIFQEISVMNEFKDSVDFVSINTDTAQDLCKNLSIHGVPTFKFIKNGKVIKEIVGLDKSADEFKKQLITITQKIFKE